MSKYDFEKITSSRLLSPKLEKGKRKLNLNNQRKNSYSTYGQTPKYNNVGFNSPMSLYSYSKLSNGSYFPDNSKISRITSPINRNIYKLNKSSSQKNIYSRPLSGNSRMLPSVSHNGNIKSPSNNNHFNESFGNNRTKQNYYNLETEKLYQETYQIKKVVNNLSKELAILHQENHEKDRQINLKEKQINDIIYRSNNSILDDNDNYYTNNMNSSKVNDETFINNLVNNPNSSTGNLIAKIKKEIKNTNNEIRSENEKLEKLKRSLFMTKINELNIESILYEEQISKVSTLLNNAMLVKEENDKKKEEYASLEENMKKQDEIINNLLKKSYELDDEENFLKDKLKETKNSFDNNVKKVNENNSQLKKLEEKKKNLISTEEKKQTYVTNLTNNPITMKTFFTNKITILQKNINHFKRQCKYKDVELTKLREHQKNLLSNENVKNLKDKLYLLSSKNFKNKKTISTDTQVNNIVINTKEEDEKITKLRDTYIDSKNIEKKLEEKVNLYQSKMREFEINTEIKDNKEDGGQNQIEFGIDNDNPYYSDDEENIPEIKNKFTSSQFNQFTYILFKNFEAKGIVMDEAKDKVIQPLIECANKNNITVAEYGSNQFDFIVDEFTKIIMNVLNSENIYNNILTKIFIGALFYNSECNVAKLIEYFNILFSYTRNYAVEEEKYINKLKTKYVEQTKKLVSCINDYVSKELNSSAYFPLLKMKELLDQNDINLKDKYIEFLFYYMKKFNDPDAKLGELKFSLLYDIIPMNDNNQYNNKISIDLNNNENIENNIIINENNNQNLMNNDNNVKTGAENNNDNTDFDNNKFDLNNNNNDDDFMNKSNKQNEEKLKKSDNDIQHRKKSKKKSATDNQRSEKSEKDNNTDDFGDDDEDSMTEITNEEYIKQLTEAIGLMQKGIKEAGTTFNDLMSNVIQKRKIGGKFYECITIEDFHEQLKSLNIILSDLKLSCLCSKYSIPNELRLIDKNKIGKDIDAQAKGMLRFDDEDNN